MGYAKAIQNAGGNVRYILYTGIDHGGLANSDNPVIVNGVSVPGRVYEVFNFFARYGGLDVNIH